MEEDKLHEQIQKGRHARSLEEPVRLAVESIKSSLHTRWEHCKDRDERDRIWVTYHLVDQVALLVSNVAAGGELAERELAQIVQGRHRVYTE